MPEAPDRYSMTSSTRQEAFAAQLLKHLGALDAYFQRVTTVDALVDEMVRGNGLYLHEELFHYLLETGDLPKARRLARGLREAFGQDSRWSRFREAMEARLVDAGLGGSLDEFLG
ncbi:hypothetical protein ACLESO_27585 [Pyxidicoccus sp. 3LG]